MRHGNKTARLGRPADQRKALVRGLVTEVLRHGKIKTTKVRNCRAGYRQEARQAGELAATASVLSSRADGRGAGHAAQFQATANKLLQQASKPCDSSRQHGAVGITVSEAISPARCSTHNTPSASQSRTQPPPPRQPSPSPAHF
jgi:ribosomal protein L17